ncbi:siderochrome-iron transporter Sit1 [Cucurbitaria berberidis CBS 394.84]|uniref:Siderochrome-iron transporter Sit1 n=1 Tax=Cucurbitaria berberidis CBS 394.84 TaxID=1168544 RepID=A0A9P4GQ86_9PLEO|nr:siderochrome-iron transporter Sit1 [Cucurbitaria berberidis CBS 394.84]KAF1849554.1 siderochrome-iron transporter Sit1 [Cucurbitaria berberidis CBS 394.84]
MSDDDEKVTIPPRCSDEERDGSSPIGFKSSGVARVEAIASHVTFANRVCIFLSIFLVAFAYSLDFVLRLSYSTTATSKLKGHALLSMVNVVKGVISVAAQPGAAKVADIFGRKELFIISVLFYITGTIIQATCDSIPMFAFGGLIWQVGYSLVVLLLEIIVADTTSLRSRVFFSYIPPCCFLIIPWFAPEMSTKVLATSNWRWAIGMWAAIYAVCALPLILAFSWVERKAKKAGSLKNIKTPYQQYGGWALMKVLFWQLDVIGIFLVTSILGHTLTPLTLAGGRQAHWGEAKIIVPIALGVASIPIFIWWETKAPYPMVPFHLLKDRAVWGALGIALHLNFAWACQADYLYTVLLVAFNESVESAARIVALYNFVSVATGILAGLLIYKVRRLKPIVMLGTFLFLVAFGLMIRYRGSTTDSSHHTGIIAAQVILGVGGGLFPYPTLVSIQAATRHEHVAVVIGLYFAIYSVGAALGNAVSGAIWTQILPRKLEQLLGGNQTLALQWYTAPLEMIAHFHTGTPERDAVDDAFKHVQRLLCIVGAFLCVALILLSCVIRDPRLPDTQSREDAEAEPIEMKGKRRSGCTSRTLE